MSARDNDDVDLDEPCSECGHEVGNLRSNGGCGDPECCGAARFDVVCAKCGAVVGQR